MIDVSRVFIYLASYLCLNIQNSSYFKLITNGHLLPTSALALSMSMLFRI